MEIEFHKKHLVFCFGFAQNSQIDFCLFSDGRCLLLWCSQTVAFCFKICSYYLLFSFWFWRILPDRFKFHFYFVYFFFLFKQSIIFASFKFNTLFFTFLCFYLSRYDRCQSFNSKLNVDLIFLAIIFSNYLITILCLKYYWHFC